MTIIVLAMSFDATVRPTRANLRRALRLAETSPEEGVTLARAACQAARAQDAPILTDALLTLGMTLVRRERFDEALDALEEAQELFQEEGATTGVLRCRWQIGVVRRFQTHLDEAAGLLENAVAGFDDAGLVDEAARARRDLAIAYNLLERWDEAGRLLVEARAFFIEKDREIEVARCDLAEGARLRSLSRYREALTFLENALTAFRSAGLDFDEAKALLMLGLVHGQLQAEEKALDYQLEAERIFTALDLPLRRAYANLFLGSVLWRLSRIREARERLEMALAWFEEEGIPRDTADCYLNLGNLSYIEGDNDGAAIAYYRALDLYTELGLESTAAWCERNLSLIDRRRGQLNRALDRLHRAVEALEAQDVDVWAADCRYKMAEIYADLQQDETALLHLERAWQVYRSEKRPLSATWCELLKAQIVDWEDGARVIETLDQVCATLSDTGLTWHVGLFSRSVGDLLLERGYTEEACRKYESAQSLFDSLGAAIDVAASQVGLGRALARSGREEDAARLLHLALKTTSEALPEWSWQAYAELGDIAHRAGEDHQALAFYREAVGALRAVRTTLPEEELAGAFAASTAPVYRRAIGLAIALNEATEALAIAEEGQAQILQQSLRDVSPHRLRDAYTEQLTVREGELRAGIAQLRQQLGLTGGTPPRSAPVDVEMHLDKLRTYRSEHRRLLQQLYAATYRPFGAGEPFDWDRFRAAVQNTLPSGWAGLVYHWLEEALVIFHVNAETVSAYVRQPSKMERAALDMCTSPAPERRMLVLHNRLPGEADPSPVGRKYRRLLYDLLIPDEVADQLAPDRPLVIVPHGDLHHLPFQALENETGFLVEEAILSYAPSLSSLEALIERDPRREAEDKVLLVGIDAFTQPRPALEWTVREIDELEQGYGTAITRLVNEEATRARLHAWDEARRLADFDMIHLASHAIFDTASGKLSGIALWDGDLTVEEIGQFKLGPATVVLSACQSGLGEINAGDEIVSLPHAFFTAGARTVVVSHWHVDDESTVDLMVEFHKQLRAGASPAHALTAAQRAICRQGLTPYEWGGFATMGAP